MFQSDVMRVSPEVSAALAQKRPVVSLESTIITHGMPFPQNVEMAKQVEADVRAGGAVPATIALMDGVIKVGLEDDDLVNLGRVGFSAAKASRRDVSALLVGKKTAGTTVATTMQISALAGIRLFATGGIGGVHRGAEDNFDISADLQELAKTPVAVVCAGAKSILDIAKTIEVLETNGVPVLGYQTAHFPAFYLRQSGFAVDHRLAGAGEAAEILARQWSLNMAGVLIANPIAEADEPPERIVQGWIDQALHAADAQNVRGKDITPFLLGKIFELSGGESLNANIALVRNNARVAAQIAVEFAQRNGG